MGTWIMNFGRGDFPESEIYGRRSCCSHQVFLALERCRASYDLPRYTRYTSQPVAIISYARNAATLWASQLLIVLVIVLWWNSSHYLSSHLHKALEHQTNIHWGRERPYVGSYISDCLNDTNGLVQNRFQVSDVVRDRKRDIEKMRLQQQECFYVRALCLRLIDAKRTFFS